MPDGERPQVPVSTAPEALIVCPICQAGLAVTEYEIHLRQAHGLCAYRGVRRSFDDTVEAMLDDLLRIPPFAVAWPALVRLAREELGEPPAPFLAHRLAGALARLPVASIGRILPDLAAVVAPGNTPLVAALATEAELAGRLLALTALTLLPSPIAPTLLQPLQVLLLDRRLPEESVVRAMAAILYGISDPMLVHDLLEKLTSGMGKARAVNRLRMVEKQAGSHPALTALCEKLQEQVRMSCPRCGVQMRRPAMLQHLWDEHRLVLDGLRVRDPWNVIEEWLDECKARNDPELLERCRIAAVKIDGDAGLARLHRLTLARGVADPEARRAHLAEAREQHASCCPWCYSLVPVTKEGPPLHVNHRPGRLSGGGYSVEIDDRGPRTWLEIRTPREVVYQDREPNRQLTVRGMAAVGAWPLILIALLLAVVWPRSVGPARWPVLVVLGLAAAAYTIIRLLGRLQDPPAQRVLDYTWRFLVPRLHASGFVAADSAFTAGLARLGLRQGDVPPEELARLVRITEHAVKDGHAPPGHLAALCRLEIERAAALGKDPVPLAVRWLTRCFEGRLPIAFAQRLLEEWAADFWTPGNLARLRILVCDRAFEAGFEVRSLIDAGQNAPALGTVLRTNNQHPLAALRLVWSLRATCPWERLGPVLTAFDLANDPDYTAALADQADVLLWQEDPRSIVVADGGRGKMTAARIQLSPVGVWLQDALFSDPPRRCEVLLKSQGCEMRLGSYLFRSPVDLDPLSRQMEKWLRYSFHEFLPQVERVMTWQSPDRAAILRAWGAVPCPGCAKYLMPIEGEIGLALDEKV
jgi:hypothetical protein